MRPMAVVAILLGGAAFGACTEVTYRGEELPGDQVAFIERADAAILAIDDLPVSGARRYAVRPGPRSVTIRLIQVANEDYFLYRRISRYESTRALTVCFMARAGHVYLAKSEVFGDNDWAPQIYDEATMYRVTSHAPGEPGWNCRAATPLPRSPDKDNARASD